MKNKILNTLLVWLLLSGCAEDKGNIDYHPVTEAKVTGIQGSYLLNLGDEWKVPVTIDFSLEEPAELDYLWKIDGDTIATTKDLDVTVSFPLKKDMISEFIVTDKSNGVQTIIPFKVTVQSEFKEGWMILSETADHSELSYFRVSDNRFYPNIYEEINKEQLASGASSLKEHFLDPLIFSETGQVLVVCENGENFSVDLDGNSFTKVIATKDEFVGSRPTDFKPQDYESIPSFIGEGEGCDYLISNGQLYTRTLYNGGCFQDGLYTNFPCNFNGGNYRLKPWFLKGHDMWGRYLLGFDEESGSFVKFEGGEIQLLTPDMDWGKQIAMVNTGMELLDGGLVSFFSEISDEPDLFVLFLKDKSGAVQVTRLDIHPFMIMMMGNFFYTTVSQKPLKDVAGNVLQYGGEVVNERSVFAFASRGSRVYIATDKQLYAFDFQTHTLSLVRTYEKNISAIAINRTNYQELGIAFDNGNATADFNVADVSYLGGGTLKKEMQTVNGQVKDVLYKVGEALKIEGLME